MRSRKIACILGIIILFSVLGCCIYNKNTDKYREFSSEIWISAPQARRVMYKALTEGGDKDITGISKEEVISLLGEPDREMTYENGTVLEYSLLKSRKINLFSGCINVYMEKGTVAGVKRYGWD